SCLATSDDDKVRANHDTTHLHEERAADFIAACPVSLYICVNANADGGGHRDINDEDGDRLAIDLLGGFALSKLVERLLVSPGRRPVAATTTRLFNTGTSETMMMTTATLALSDALTPPLPLTVTAQTHSPLSKMLNQGFCVIAKVFDLFNQRRSLSQVLNQMA
ncbi:unnamed protein product, partial [Musa banksii]